MSGGNWQPIETAPKDGTWMLLEGEFEGGDTSAVKLGRWEPRTYMIGSQAIEYEWRILDESFAGVDQPTARPNWNWSADGRVFGWMPLPDTEERP